MPFRWNSGVICGCRWIGIEWERKQCGSTMAGAPALHEFIKAFKKAAQTVFSVCAADQSGGAEGTDQTQQLEHGLVILQRGEVSLSGFGSVIDVYKRQV